MIGFWQEVRKNPAGFYALIAFLTVWGSLMLWGLSWLVGALNRRRAARRLLRRKGYNSPGTDQAAIQKIRRIASDLIYSDIGRMVDATPRGDLIRTTSGKGYIRLEYETADAPVHIERPIGVKGKIQMLRRRINLKKLLYDATEGIESCYFEYVDSLTHREYRGQKTNCYRGWVFGVFSPSGVLSRVVIRRKQRGSSAILMKMAMKVAGVHPANPGGLLPAFEETYDIVSTEHGESPSLGENTQRALISIAENLQGGETFTIDPQGAWVNADKWPKRKIFERLTELCRELARPRAESEKRGHRFRSEPCD